MVIKMIKYGILSTASIVERFVKGIRESKNGEVYAIASRSLDKAMIYADKLGIKKYYGSYQELFEDEEVDIVYIPTVNGLHYRDCKNALLHHKHVICEKPFTLNKEEALELFELARKNNCFLMEGQKAVFLPTTKKVKELIENNVIGQIKYIEFKAGFPGRFTYDHWMYDLKMGGGALYGSATYTIEYLQYLFNHPDMTISSTYLPCPTGSDEICHFQLILNKHILVSSTIAMNVGLKNEAVFYGEKGYIVVPHYWKANQLHIYLNNQAVQQIHFPYNSEFVYEINHVHDCLRNGLLQSPVMNQDKTIQTIELVNELYKTWNLK